MGKSGKDEAQKKFDKLLKELQEDYAASVGNSETAVRVPERTSDNQVPITRIVPFPNGFPNNEETWQRAKSDVSVKYALHYGVIHDKSCPQIQKISAHMLEFVKSYPSGGVQCCNCSIKAYIRNGAKDIENYEKYVSFFHRVGLKSKGIRRLYIDNDVKTRIDTDVLTIWHKEDTWKIKASPGTTRVDLLHNNYTIINNGRVFTEGFHPQKKCATIHDALDAIFSYNFEHHLQPKKQPEVEPPVTIEKPAVYTPEPTEEKAPLISRLKDRIRRKLLCYLKLEKSISIDGLVPIEYAGRPSNGEVCVILWKAKDNQEHWIIAMYVAKKARFIATIGGYQVRISEERVIAWKSLDLTSLSEPAPNASVGSYIIY